MFKRRNILLSEYEENKSNHYIPKFVKATVFEKAPF